ncbi:hypothetical protein RRG08_009972 [Elysia crispata]|uniref:Uncharacterized protein n=1 Tax=Elysia crispata TaxID=231223 RepID=A0AAE1B4V5_9GAST|nr:hypothetical protein RRG08_009972 [Elysia crispata]
MHQDLTHRKEPNYAVGLEDMASTPVRKRAPHSTLCYASKTKPPKCDSVLWRRTRVCPPNSSSAISPGGEIAICQAYHPHVAIYLTSHSSPSKDSA